MQSQILTYLREQHHLTVDKFMSSQMVVLGSVSQSTHSETFPAVLQILVFKSIRRHFFETSVCPYNQIWKINHAPIALWVMLILCNFVNMYN